MSLEFDLSGGSSGKIRMIIYERKYENSERKRRLRQFSLNIKYDVNSLVKSLQTKLHALHE